MSGALRPILGKFDHDLVWHRCVVDSKSALNLEWFYAPDVMEHPGVSTGVKGTFCRAFIRVCHWSTVN